MKKSFSPYWLVMAVLMVSGLIGLLFVSIATYEAQAQVPPPPGPPPRRPTPVPTAQLRISNVDKVISPATLKSGIPMTYTVKIDNDSVSTMDARDATLEIPLMGDQKYVSMTATQGHWKLREPVTDRIIVDLGRVRPGEGGTVTINAIMATNYDKPIFRQTIYVTWVDEFQSRRAGFNLTLPMELPAPGQVTPVPDPRPPSANPSGLPTTGPFAPVPDPGTPNNDERWYFAATRHTLSGEFLRYWLGRSTQVAPNGSVIAFGFPISEPFQDNGRLIQYFERAVMEFWPENQSPYRVLLRPLGREVGISDDAISASVPSASGGSIYFGETGHWLDGRFVDTWYDLGGLAQFGFPIGEAVVTQDNKLVQWTERARFELDLSRPNQLVMLGLIGTESAKNKGYLPK